MHELLFADRFLVRGFPERYRQHGLGVPLIAVSQTSTNIPVAVSMPVTAVLELQGDVTDLAAGHAKARLVLHSAYDSPTIMASGHAVPMETDLTAPLAYTLNDSFIW